MRRAVRFAAPDGTTRLGRLENATIIDAGPVGARGFDATAESWRLIEDARGTSYALGEVRLLAPCRPDAVLCVGSNYKDHIAEAGLITPEYPVVFAKLGSSIIGPDDPIVVPFDEPETDWEAELAIVIGTTAKRVAGDAARAVIGGVTAINDVSGRWAQLTTGMGQFLRGKSFDTFSPIGPCVVHPDDIDMHDLRISLSVNGVTMQDSNTSYLLFSPEELVEWLAAGTTLQPGDVIATGTPGGVGHALVPPQYLRGGDVVEVTIEHIGTLSNPVIEEAAGS